MLARLQQVITFSLVLVSIAWFMGFFVAGSPGWGLVGALLIAFGYALALAAEFIMLGLTHGDDPTPRASLPGLLHAWWGEVLMGPRVFCWRQPFRSEAEPDHLPIQGMLPVERRRGVVFVHGLVCNRGFWNPYLKQFRADDIPFSAISLEPVFGPIDAYTGQIEAAVQRIEKATGMRPVVVAHSMGGLAVRAWLQRHDADDRIHRIITIGSPHRGTWLARFARSLQTRQMALNSPWLQSLAAGEPAWRASNFTCIYSNCDNIVFPPSTATLPGADNRHVPGWSHVHLAFSDEVGAEIRRWLR